MGKICPLYLLEKGQGQRDTTPSSSFDNTRTINKEIVHSFQLKYNTNHDPITKSGSALQPR